MLLIDGKLCESQVLPRILFGRKQPLAYVLNPKAGCTLALHFLFYVNHGYRYFDISRIHFSNVALLRLESPELDPVTLHAFYRLAPERFSIVRDPVRRFVSGFNEKILLGGDHGYDNLRDFLTAEHDIDLGPEANPARSCLAFARWYASFAVQKWKDVHFLPQCHNLKSGSRFTVDTILRLEDRDALFAFFAKWIGEEKANWFLSLNFNVQKYNGSSRKRVGRFGRGLTAKSVNCLKFLRYDRVLIWHAE